MFPSFPVRMKIDENGAYRLEIEYQQEGKETSTAILIRAAADVEELKGSTSIYIGSPLWKWKGVNLLCRERGKRPRKQARRRNPGTQSRPGGNRIFLRVAHRNPRLERP